MFGTDDVLLGSSNVAGLQVQMAFWAQSFSNNGWDTYSFSKNKKQTLLGIHYIEHKESSLLKKFHLSIIDTFRLYWKGFTIQPSLIIFRGFSKGLYLLATLCRLFRVKLVFFGASDVNFCPGKELPAGNNDQTKAFQKGLKKVDYFVAQNSYQNEMLYLNYKKEALVLPNIWIEQTIDAGNEKKYAAVWVSNFRKLKRPEWFVELAKALPQYKFAIAGGGRLDCELYDKIHNQAETLQNLDFLGPQPWLSVLSLMSSSFLVVCTSEFEGFPNTFLQAWSLGLPVVSTVDPSEIIIDNKLGFVVESPEELIDKVALLITDNTIYNKCADNVTTYFVNNHSAQIGYSKLIEYINN